MYLADPGRYLFHKYEIGNICASEGNISCFHFLAPCCRERAVCFKFQVDLQGVLLFRNRFLSKTDLSARWPALQSRYQSHLFPAFCEIQLFATCPDSFCFCLQASLQRGQSWNWQIRSGAAQVLVASCNAHILFDTPPASISHHTSFCFGQIIEKVILRSGAPFHISIFRRQCLNSFLPDFWIALCFVGLSFEWN